MAPPVQTTSFRFGQLAQTITRSGGAEVAFPMVLTLGTVLRPAEVWFGVGGLVPMKRLSAHNDSFVRSVRLVPPEEINYASFDGTPVAGWLMRTPGWHK